MGMEKQSMKRVLELAREEIRVNYKKARHLQAMEKISPVYESFD